MSDPLRPGRGDANLGSAALGRTSNGNWELGSILAYNSGTHTAMVRTHSGRPLYDVPQIKGTATGYDHLQTGTTVVVSWDLGFPAIIGCIDIVGATQAAIPAPSLTGVAGVGSADLTQPTEGSNSYKSPKAPTDMGPGDWAQVGTLGNHVAVLEGGVSLLGSPTAHVQSVGPSGTLRLIARSIEQFTDFGQLRVQNLEGRTSLILRAGSNQSTQTGLDEQHWTIRLDLGATGDIFDFNIVEPEGKTLFRMHAGSDGRVQIYGDGGVDISSGAKGTTEMRHDVAGPRATAVAGSDTRTVEGDTSTEVGGSSVTTIAGGAARNIGRDSVDFVGNDHTSAVGGDASLTIAGKQTAVIGDDVTQSIDGKWGVAVVKQIDVSTKTTMALEATGAAKLNGRTVTLGASGKHPLPKFDVFLRDLAGALGDVARGLGGATPLGLTGQAAITVAIAKINVFVAKASAAFPYISTKVRND